MSGDERRFVVDARHDGERLDRFLQAHLSDLSRSQLGRLVDAGHVRVGGRRPKAGLKVVAGEEVAIVVPAPAPSGLVPVDRPLVLLHDDADLAVVDKPAGLAVHPAPGTRGDTLVQVLLARLSGLSGVGGVERPGIVHRLDKDTTGVLVVAKHDRAHEALRRQFHDRTVAKTYLALVLGRPREAAGRIDRPIGRHRTERARMGSVAPVKARSAETEWRVREELGPATLLEVRPRTGRTHQIRAHLADAGHSIVGDVLYGFERRVRGVVDARARHALERAARPMLHALALELTHPTTGARMRFEAPVPRDFAELVEALRRLAGGGGSVGTSTIAAREAVP